MYVKNKIKSFLSLAITMAIVTLSLAVPINTRISASAETYPTPPEGIKVWNGTTEEILCDEGTNDYHVYTAEQLAYVLSTSQTWKTIYLENDIYLNDLSEYDSWDTTDAENLWVGNDEASEFHDVTINGQNHIIYGLFDYDDENGGNVGLVHTTKGQGHIAFYNLGIDYAYIQGRFASAFLATMDTNNDGYCNVTFENCFVGEHVTITSKFDSGSAGAGGFIGGYDWYSGIQTNGQLNLNNCYSLATVGGNGETGAFCGRTMNKNIDMKHCYTIQSEMFGFITPYWDNGAYGKVDSTVNYAPIALTRDGYSYTTACDAEMMQGDYAAVNMVGLGSAYSVTGSYPILTCFDKNNEYKTFAELQRELFAGGSGTEADPFLIATKDNLKNMLNYFGGNNHYKLTNDIYVNYLDSFDRENGTALDSSNPPESWFAANSEAGYTNKTDGKADVFNGTVDGNGYAVHGIRYPRISQWEKDQRYTLYAGLIPVMGNGTVKNLIIADSYLSVSCCEDNKAVFIGAVAGKITGTVSISSVMVEDTVMIEALHIGENIYNVAQGGIVGDGSSATINMTDIGMLGTIKDDGGFAYAGGLVSEIWNSALTIKNCFTKDQAAVNKNNEVASMSLTNVFSNAGIRFTDPPKASWNYSETNKVSVVDDLTLATLSAAGFNSANWQADNNGYPVLACRVNALASLKQVTLTFKEGNTVLSTISSYMIDENGHPATLTEVDPPKRDGYVFAGWSPEYTVGAAWPESDTVYTATWTRIGFMGDINMDDKVNILDLVRLKKYTVDSTVVIDSANELFVDFEGAAAQLAALRKYLLTGSWHMPTLFADEGYTYVWGDEFNADTLNSNKWESEATGTYNDRIYSNDTNLTLDNNSLNLMVVGKKKTDGTATYCVAEGLRTLSTMNFQYGYLEMKIKAPVQSGVWPGFWLSGLNGPWSDDFNRSLTRDTKFEDYGTEIDILEQYRTKDIFTTSLHKWYPGAVPASKSNVCTYEFDGDYHIYGFKWTPKEISIYVDGKLCYSYDLSANFDKEGYNTTMDGFKSPHYLRIGNDINTAENGWKESPLTSDVNCTLSVDWIRLYQIPGQGDLWTK